MHTIYLLYKYYTNGFVHSPNILVSLQLLTYFIFLSLLSFFFLQFHYIQDILTDTKIQS